MSWASIRSRGRFTMSQRVSLIRSGSHAVFALLAFGACQSKTPEPPQAADAGTSTPVAPTSTQPPRIGASLKLATTVAPAQLALTASARGYSGAFRTHRVQIVDGIVELTTIHHDVLQGEVVGGTATLETTSITRGDEAVGAGATATQLVAPDTLSIARGAATEKVVNREDGIEQTWTFAQEPA